MIETGNRVEWFYERTGDVVFVEENLWSSVLNCWVSIGSNLTHVITSIDDDVIAWANERGNFSAKRTDTVTEFDFESLFTAKFRIVND